MAQFTTESQSRLNALEKSHMSIKASNIASNPILCSKGFIIITNKPPKPCITGPHKVFLCHDFSFNLIGITAQRIYSKLLNFAVIFSLYFKQL